MSILTPDERRLYADPPSWRSPVLNRLWEAYVALETAQAQAKEPCLWTYDEADDVWDTTCGKSWVFTAGGSPADNHVRYCHGCGRPVSAESVSDMNNRRSA